MTITILLENKLVQVRILEQLPQGTVYAIQTADLYNALQEISRYPGLRTIAVRDQIYTLRREGDGYIFRCTQSPYGDNSGTGLGANGHHQTAGDAIKAFMNSYHKDGFRIMCGQLEICQDVESFDVNMALRQLNQKP